jgi:hypothetical protein
MRQLRAAIVALLFGSLLVGSHSQGADEVRSPVAGTWKVLLVNSHGQEIALAILKIDVKDGKAEAAVVATGPDTIEGAKVEDARADGASFHLTLKTQAAALRLAAYAPPKAGRPRVLRGSLQVRNSCEIIVAERTTDRQLDANNLVADGAGAEELKKLNTDDDKKLMQAYTTILEKHFDKPVAYVAARRVFGALSRSDGGHKVLRAVGEQFRRLAAEYGRETELHAAAEIARALVKQVDGIDGPFGALDVARRAEKLLAETDAPARQLSVQKVFLSALRKSKTSDPAAVKAVEERVARLDAVLDTEFEKTNLTFKPEPFPGRKEKGGRVAVVELFTGAHCPPCVPADKAFDALLQTYRPSEVILLQYHLHVPQPDPLTNADAELCAAMYGVEATPTIFVNGKTGPPLGGLVSAAEAGYKRMRTLFNETLEGQAKAGIDLAVKRDGDRIEATATITSLKSEDEARLRVFLVEDVVRYQGTNGQRLHHHIVRAVIADEKAKLPKGEAVPQKFTVSVSDVRKKLAAYLEESNKEAPFLDDERPLDLKRLKVVALIQEKESKEILHAVQADVPEGK